MKPELDGLLHGLDEQDDDDNLAAHGDGIGDHEDLERAIVAMKGDTLGLVLVAGHGEGGGGDGGDERVATRK